jgi:PhzF family phenazine biosynthesis protein
VTSAKVHYFCAMVLYQIDAFTDKLFGGNPAAVIPLDGWPSDNLMQSIAAENNLAETAFIVSEGEDFRIRWFTPGVEVDLCGHATLATAFVIFNELNYPHDQIRLHSRSGLLTVSREGDWLTLDFPADPYHPVDLSEVITNCTNATIREAYRGKRDFMLVLENQDEVMHSSFDQMAILQLGHCGLIVTAPGDKVDFVSRFFAPAYAIPEDPVTGSSHCTLTPYWANRLGKNTLTARQLSRRGGYLKCTLNDVRVSISGKAVMYMKGKLEVSNMLVPV